MFITQYKSKRQGSNDEEIRKADLQDRLLHEEEKENRKPFEEEIDDDITQQTTQEKCEVVKKEDCVVMKKQVSLLSLFMDTTGDQLVGEPVPKKASLRTLIGTSDSTVVHSMADSV